MASRRPWVWSALKWRRPATDHPKGKRKGKMVMMVFGKGFDGDDGGWDGGDVDDGELVVTVDGDNEKGGDGGDSGGN